MPSQNIPHDEWIELVAEDLEDDYSIVVDGTQPIYLKPGSKPHQSVAGLPLQDGAIFSAEIDRGDAVWARAQNDTDGSARAVPGIRIDGANERAVTVQTSVTSNVYSNGADFDKSGSYPHTFDPSETVKEILLSIVSAEFELKITTVDGDVVNLRIDRPSTIDSYEVDSFELQDPQGNVPRVAGGWAGE